MAISSKWLCWAATTVAAALVSRAAPTRDEGAEKLQAILEQNQRLERQIAAQQETIAALQAQMAEFQRKIDGPADGVTPSKNSDNAAPARELRISGQAGMAFFSSGSAGQFPHSEFRLDDAKVFLESPVIKDVYFFAGIELFTREASDESNHLGELYTDWENFGGAKLDSGFLNLRLGRFSIPFGEEYQSRDPVSNPLISHSLSDIWGQDEGVELFGSKGAWDYVFAVQNGGNPLLHDYDADKALVARIGYTGLTHLRLSASAMRTGDLNTAGDVNSAVWFGNGFFRSINPSAATFSADLFEGDANLQWATGHLGVLAGYVKYNGGRALDSRVLHYYSGEIVQSISGPFYAAARYSSIRSPSGYPLVGQGNFGTFVFRTPATTELQRWSLGLGLRFSPPLVWKVEYSFENGALLNGAARNQEDQMSSELALKF